MMKVLIRCMLVAASCCMVIGNWENGFWALSASFMFVAANLAALVYNGIKK